MSTESSGEKSPSETSSQTRQGKLPQGKQQSGHRSSARNRSAPAPPKALLVAIRLLAVVALGLSAYLSYVSFEAVGPAGCGGGGLIDCDHVIKSRWSTWFGVPVSLIGAVVYLGIFVMSWILEERRENRIVFRALGFIAGLAALWFVGIQLLVIQKICLYCLAVHIVGISTCILITTYTQIEQRQYGRGRQWMRQPAILACLGIIVLAAGQLMFAPSTMQIVDDTPQTTAPANSSEPSKNLPQNTENVGKAAISESDENAATATPPPSDSPMKHATTPGRDLAKKSKPSTSPNKSLPNSQTANPSTSVPDTSNRTRPQSAEKRPPAKKSTKSAAIPRKSARTVSIMQGRQDLAIDKFPFVGDPDAEYIIVKMFDYSCPDCRRLHHQLHAYDKIAKRTLAYLLIPVPMNTECNPFIRRNDPKHLNACHYSKIALAVWTADATKFQEFHDWMMQGEKPPALDEVKSYAEKLIGVDDISALASSSEVRRRFSRVMEAYRFADAGIVPKLFVRFRKIEGVPKDPTLLHNALDKILQ